MILVSAKRLYTSRSVLTLDNTRDSPSLWLISYASRPVAPFVLVNLAPLGSFAAGRLQLIFSSYSAHIIEITFICPFFEYISC